MIFALNNNIVNSPKYIKIKSVKNSKDFKTFYKVPFQLYKNNPYWIPPFRKEFKDFYNRKNIELKTDLNDEEIQAMTLAEFTNWYVKKHWNINLNLVRLTKNTKAHKVSKKRLGRTEGITVLRESAIPTETEEKSNTQRVLGL